jgi:hypothetical protein
MKVTAKRGALLGLLVAVLAIVALLTAAFAGADPPGGLDERLMGLTLQLTLFGAPLSLVIMHLGDMLDPRSNWHGLLAWASFAALLIQWPFVGFLIGWAAERWQRRG